MALLIVHMYVCLLGCVNPDKFCKCSGFRTFSFNLDYAGCNCTWPVIFMWDYRISCLFHFIFIVLRYCLIMAVWVTKRIPIIYLPFGYPAQHNFVTEIQALVLRQFESTDHESEVRFALSRPNFARWRRIINVKENKHRFPIIPHVFCVFFNQCETTTFSEFVGIDAP